MEASLEKSAEILFEQNIISSQQLANVKAYRSLGIFSVRNELLFLLYIAILMVSGGLGILIYQNIDTIGHSILIGITLLAAVCCFYFSFRKATRFSAAETFFENPLLDYVVLLGTLLSGTFFGYLQFQYSPLGNDFALAALLTSIVGFGAAYRFDNRSSLSIGITALAATVGITITPKAVMELDVFSHLPMFYIGILLGAILIVWAEYSERTSLKKHFAPVFYVFAQHLTGICCIVGMVQEFWPLFLILLAAATGYFFLKSHKSGSVAMFVFALLYGFIGFNIAIIRLVILVDSEYFMLLCTYLAPIFYVGSIVLFILQIKKFNKDA